MPDTRPPAPAPVLVATAAALRRACDGARAAGHRVGLVPTMGYLHEGHRSLIRAARARTDYVVVSIFVNPLQFGPAEDLARYPRDLDRDAAAAREEHIDVLFVPPDEEMWPEPPLTTVHVARLTDGMCGAARPTHFDGVATVVAKLLTLVGPCTAYFGRKDAQQLAVVARMVDDLALPVEVVGCPLVREPDGVALSSRNAYLSGEERGAARVLFRGLRAGAAAAAAGERDAARVAAAVEGVLAAEPAVAVEYVEVRAWPGLEPVECLPPAGEVLVALAARVGATRLIDNVRLCVAGGEVTVDLGTGYRAEG